MIPPGSTAVDNSHTDVLVNFSGGSGAINIRFGHANTTTGGGTTLPSASAELVGNANTANTIDEVPPGFEFTGATPNSTLWSLEQGLTGGMIYLGINSAETDLSKLVAWNPGEPAKNAGYLNKFIQISLIAVRGPGHFSFWQDGDSLDQPVVYMSSFVNGVDAQDRAFHAVGGHDHFNWSFTQAGSYEVDWQLSTFLVVPEPGTGALLATGLLLASLRRRRTPSDAPSLSQRAD